MKKTLSLFLSLTLSSLSFVAAAAVPVRGQDQIAAVGKTISDLKDEYERLRRIELAPGTPSEIREKHNTFLEERRTRLREALQARLSGFRTYRAMLTGPLSEREGQEIDKLIRGLEEDLRALDASAGQAQPAPARAAAADQPAPAAPRKSAGRLRRSAPAMIVKVDEESFRPVAPEAAAPAAANAAPAKAEAAPTAAPREGEALVITSPSADTTVGVDTIEIEVTVNSEDVNTIDVFVYKGDETKNYAGRPNVEVRRSDKGKKKVPVRLRKGVNRIEVTSKDIADTSFKAIRKVTFTSSEMPIGGGGGGAAAAAAGSGVTIGALGSGSKFTNVPDVGTNVRVGYRGEADKLYQFFVTKRDGTRQDAGSPMARGLNGTATAVFPELNEGDTVGVVEVVDGEPVANTLDTIRVESQIDTTKGFPIGFLVGGAVMSQQAQEFGQSDPFFGFIAGYNFKIHSAVLKRRCGNEAYWLMEDGTQADENGFTVRCDEAKKVLLYKTANGEGFAFVEKSDSIELIKSASKRRRNGSLSARRLNLRFQGLFQSDPRRAEATETTATDGDGDGGEPQPADPFKFVASRKTFDVEMHGWIDFWANNMFTLGPYAAVGASTVLDKNELQGEAVTGGEQDAGADDPATADSVATTARSDNDIKKYYEFGLLSNTQLFNRSLFIQSILAYGNYEALSGLYDGDCRLCDTKHRFVGKLRVWPAGLSREFGRQIQAAPMFGVDLNAGRGPDHLKFFTGFAVRIRGIGSN